MSDLKQHILNVWQSAAERHWCGHQQIEKATGSMYVCVCVCADGQHFEHFLMSFSWKQKIIMDK